MLTEAQLEKDLLQSYLWWEFLFNGMNLNKIQEDQKKIFFLKKIVFGESWKAWLKGSRKWKPLDFQTSTSRMQLQTHISFCVKENIA